MVPAGACISPQSPSLKRLLKPPNPILHDPHPKKTRHLPNLSDCHSCGRHVTTPTTPLPSLWRIVLLCNPCLIRIRSADSCSYCFAPAAHADSFRCPACRRHVHRDCAARYESSAPWSYCIDFVTRESGFTGCIDCWVPKSLELPPRVTRNSGLSNGGREGKKNGVTKSIDLSGKVCKSRRSEGEGRVLNKIGVCKKGKDLKLCSNGDDKDQREKKKVAVAGRGKEKMVVAKRVLEYVDGEMRLTKKKRESERKDCSVGCSSIGSGFDDAELAIRLHRVMNSSPRISRRFLLGSSSGLDKIVVKVDSGDLPVRPLEPKGRFGFTYKRRGSYSKLSDDVGATCSEGSVSVTSSDEGNSKHELLVYRRKCKTCDECQVKEEVDSENSCMVFENQKFYRQDLLVYSRKGKQCDEYQVKNEVAPDDGMVLENQICHKQDLLVYKRKVRACDECQVKNEVIPENGMIFENQICHTQGVLVYRRKCKKEDECQENAEVPENIMYLENQSSHTDDELGNKLSFDNNAIQDHLECNGTCNVKLETSDRYALKFRKGYKRSKELTNSRGVVWRNGPCTGSGKEATELG